MQKVTYIHPDGPKLSYINKVEIHDKVVWGENKIQFIMNPKYNHYILLHYCVCHTTSPFPPRPHLPSISSILQRCLWYINVPRASFVMAFRTCLTSYPSGNIKLSMYVCAIFIKRRHLGKTSSSWSIYACSSSSIFWWVGLNGSLRVACTIYICDILKNHQIYPST